jgi:DNA-binding NarL/FixJ family response regulator
VHLSPKTPGPFAGKLIRFALGEYAPRTQILLPGSAAFPSFFTKGRFKLPPLLMTKTRKSKYRILIVDDHPMMRQGLVQLISQETDLTVSGEADTAAQALQLVGSLKPNLVLVDISLPDRNGLELIKDLRATGLHPPVLVFSMHDESLYAERALRAGARGYIMKQEGGGKLVQAIRQVLAGQIFVSEKISARALEAFSGRRSGRSASSVEGLSDREFEVFQLIGEGKATREIAHLLHLSIKTVEVHRANIKLKLGIKKGSELVHYAIRWREAEGGPPPDS